MVALLENSERKQAMLKQFLKAALLATMVALGCTAGPAVPPQAEARAWFVEHMTEVGQLTRESVERCTTEELDAVRLGDEAYRQAVLDADMAWARVGRAMEEQGVAAERDAVGQPLITFQEDIGKNAWRTIWPDVDELMEAVDRMRAALRANLEAAGCL